MLLRLCHYVEIMHDNVQIMNREFEYQGVSVIIASRECIQTVTKKKRTEASAE